jgi:hypothetical protein
MTTLLPPCSICLGSDDSPFTSGRTTINGQGHWRGGTS